MDLQADTEAHPVAEEDMVVVLPLLLQLLKVMEVDRYVNLNWIYKTFFTPPPVGGL